MREVRAHLGQAMRPPVARLARVASVPPPAEVPLSVPPQAAFGDLSTPLALASAQALGRRSREVAAEILGAPTLNPCLL